MQSFMEALPNVGSVRVTRQDLTAGKFTWSITFLDQGDIGAVSVNTVNFVSSTGTHNVAAPTVIVQGAAYTSCTGAQTIPGLTQGTPYFVRVFAYNKIGFGPPVVSPSTTKPIIVPGAPTCVSLISLSGTSLQVRFSAPLDNGGDAGLTYLIEYDTDPLFTTRQVLPMTAVQGGQPFKKEIPGLIRGTVYYVRVKAVNSQGPGAFAVSDPTHEFPREIPTAPTNVRVAITSGRVGDGKVTVAWAMPTCDGGAPVTNFRVKWDVVEQFNSLELYPNKDEVSILVTDSMSTTLSGLTPGRIYYISVAAENMVGRRYISAALSVVPSLQAPGKPWNPLLSLPMVCTNPSCIKVDWTFPHVPKHGIFCSGLGTPNDCPVTMGRGTQADGGAPITHYTLEWSRYADFCVVDATADVPASAAGTFTYTIQNLFGGSTYYVRLYAVNTAGRGDAVVAEVNGSPGNVAFALA